MRSTAEGSFWPVDYPGNDFAMMGDHSGVCIFIRLVGLTGQYRVIRTVLAVTLNHMLVNVDDGLHQSPYRLLERQPGNVHPSADGR